MKRLAICADGTWNVRDQVDKTTGLRRPTNVTKVARAILTRGGAGDTAVTQIVVYHEGIGTGSGLDKYTGGAFGDGIEANIRDLYRSIVYNFDAGDELFFFGFSRGAFTVRALIGFMNAVGILQKGDDYWLPELYGCYQQGKRPGSPEWANAMRGLEHPVLPCPSIKFVGVWDTVGALGAPGFLGQLLKRDKYAYLDVSLNEHIEHAYQALAVNERRKPFAPSIWVRPNGWDGTIEQAWFPGFHSDVGGGEHRDGLANQALHWIVDRAEKHGLAFDGEFLSYYKPCYNGDMHDSMSNMYRVLGPIDRTMGLGAAELPHTCAVDRMNDPTCQYSHEGLTQLIAAHPGQMYETTRLPTRSTC